MSRLIDADELRKNVLKWMPSDPCGKEEKEFPFETDICASMVMEIDDAPTVQPDTTTHDSIPAETGGNDEDRTSGDCISRQQATCEYCHEDSDGYVKPIEKNGHAFVRFGMDGWELSLSAKGWHGGAKIRFCPMCGRKLRGDRDETN